MLIGAMREYFRGLKLILLFVIVAFIATSFLYFGSDSLRMGNARSNPAIASVNGEEISPARFQRVQRNYIEYYRRAYQQDITPEMAERLGLTQQVINDLIQESLVLQQAKREGITVSDEELRLRIQTIPAFQDDGRFSRERYLAQLKQARIEPAEFEAEVRREMLRQKMEAIVKDGIKVSDAEVEQVYHARFERVRADWALIESAPLMAQVAVNDADAEAYLKSHEAQFTRPERRRIEYVLVAPRSFALAVTDADAEAYYKEHRGEFERPQRLKASHILVRVPPTGGSEAENKSKAKVEEAIRRAKGGEDFGKIARELSEDTATAPQGGDLGFVGKGEMVPQFEEAVFALKKGEVSPQPVRTPFGYHAIKVFDVQDGGVQPFREIVARIKEKLAAERSERAAVAKADEARVVLAVAKDFSAEAKKLGLDAKEVTVARGDGLEGMGRDQQLEETMFGLTVGGVSTVIRTSGRTRHRPRRRAVPAGSAAVRGDQGQGSGGDQARARADDGGGEGEGLRGQRGHGGFSRDGPAGQAPGRGDAAVLEGRASQGQRRVAGAGASGRPAHQRGLHRGAGAGGGGRVCRQDRGTARRGGPGLREGPRPDAHPASRVEAQRSVGALDQDALQRRPGQDPGRDDSRRQVTRMSIPRTPMTREGHNRLKEELDRLKRVERPAITRAIAEARAHGDLSENAEYHAAREKQSFVEARINDLESKVGSAEVIEPPTSGDRVTFGSTVRVEDQSGKESRYQIVGSEESDPASGRLSIMAPLARALIGKKVGDTVTAQLPGGTKTFEILEANFPWA